MPPASSQQQPENDPEIVTNLIKNSELSIEELKQKHANEIRGGYT